MILSSAGQSHDLVKCWTVTLSSQALDTHMISVVLEGWGEQHVVRVYSKTLK